MFLCGVALSQPSSRDLDYPLWCVYLKEIKCITKTKCLAGLGFAFIPSWKCIFSSFSLRVFIILRHDMTCAEKEFIHHLAPLEKLHVLLKEIKMLIKTHNHIKQS